jgi:hypothetical protein
MDVVKSEVVGQTEICLQCKWKVRGQAVDLEIGISMVRMLS